MSLTPVLKSEDEHLHSYLVSLRETLVECYTTIVHGVTQNQSKFILVNNSSALMSFLGGLMQQQINPSMVNFFLTNILRS